MTDTYRKNVGIILINDDYRVLLARRNDPSNAWQFPQGGIDGNECVESALYRELKEELDLNPKDVRLVTRSQHWYGYDFPNPIKKDNDLYIGQKQQWFLLKLATVSCPLNLYHCQTPEFNGFQWVSYWHPIYCIVPFKRTVYQKVLKEFSQHLPCG